MKYGYELEIEVPDIELENYFNSVKNKILPKKKNMEEVVSWLKHELGAIEIEKKVLESEKYFNRLKYFRLNCMQGETVNEKLDIHVFEIINNPQSKKYFEEKTESRLLILTEYNTLHFECDSNLLTNEIIIELGITAEEYENETEEYIEYVMALFEMDYWRKVYSNY